MEKRTVIFKNRYVDSVSLMSIGSKVKKEEGVHEAVVAMATDMNKEILSLVQLSTDESSNASSNDLVIAIIADRIEKLDEAFELIEASLGSSAKKTGAKTSDKTYQRLDEVVEDDVNPSLAIISIPGKYAAREAKRALRHNMDVMIFSDNMTIEEEVELKTLAAANHQLVMGPDCGTAVISGAGLCFANEVSSGDIGIVAASGTGCQEVMVQIDRLGGGITDAIGTGGRDLSVRVGGLMMLEGLRRLEADDQTNVIVCVSKPPAKEVQDKMFERIASLSKPVVVCFLGNHEVMSDDGHIYYASSLYEAAVKAVNLSKSSHLSSQIHMSASMLNEIQDYQQAFAGKLVHVAGLYCGGTLCYEALDQLSKRVEVKSNVGHGKQEYQKQDVNTNILLDLGDDEYTNGRPHPMIEPSLRNEHILEFAKRDDVGVLLLDFELGYGSSEDPVGETLSALIEAKQIAAKEQRSLAIVGYVCGTSKDKQGYKRSVEALKDAGVLVASSNMEACSMVEALLLGGKSV